ncbi:Membrane of protein [Halorhabdus tiamatea SARL4B]|uniref:Conserved hypothetical membrane protein (DUF63) n=1 Tax=Halorhabdus tiamatea SARL4B TaxID=1033806 RepID=F7PHQ2_9EURY|nr:DUF63 family protein [Halorhabdus tiamatea]ERJ06896.1 Membrane of protein [Halorhabdus tiamatea SARL4B]CCQ32400.1 conserved hypothetical membrane protein (DUF63) [Halorhabdus tiamatea SARL4B]
MVLPSGFVVPALPYLVVLGLGLLLTTLLLLGLEPPVGKGHVLALLPWMAVGGIAHGFYQIPNPPGLYPEWAGPLFGAPAVYLTTYVLVATVWLLLIVLGTATNSLDRVVTYLGATGLGVLLVFLGVIIWQGMGPELSFQPLWPTVAFLVALVLTATTYFLVSLKWTGEVARTGVAGVAVVFAHAFDGVITTVGKDVLGAHERTPIPATIMDFAGQLPTAEYIGSGWLFLVVKLLLATAVVVAFAEYIEERPARGSLFLALITAVGIGPAMNNVVIYILG